MLEQKRVEEYNSSRFRDISYKTFWLHYYISKNDYFPVFNRHILRPSTATYEEATDMSTTRCVSLDSALVTFDNDCSLQEVLLECTLRGYKVDFIDLVNIEQSRDRFSPNEKIIKVIDTHKDDINEYIDKLEFPQYYLVERNEKNLKYGIVDRLKQSIDFNTVCGEYSEDAVIAAFSDKMSAIDFVTTKNGKENGTNEKKY